MKISLPLESSWLDLPLQMSICLIISQVTSGKDNTCMLVFISHFKYYCKHSQENIVFGPFACPPSIIIYWWGNLKFWSGNVWYLTVVYMYSTDNVSLRFSTLLYWKINNIVIFSYINNLLITLKNTTMYQYWKTALTTFIIGLIKGEPSIRLV